MSRTFYTNQSIGEYRIVDFLGAGGMGEVYRAIHSKIGRVAAVKVLTQATQSSGFVERFFNEARIQASLQHPNIATLYDFMEVSGQPCIIMEYIDGQTISERISAYGAPLPLSETVYVFEKVCEAIEYIHRHGIIHRDIKSNNIKISSQGQVKLLDFGIAKGQTSQQLTQVGSVIGTLQYLAPELIRGGTADERGDIWALGVLLYEMVAGRVPFEATTVGDLCDKIDRVSYVPPAQLNPGTPPAVVRIIARCLKKNPAERYRNASELLADAKNLAAAVSKPGPSPTVDEAVTEYVEAKTGDSSRVPLFVGAGVGVLVLLVFGAIALFALWPSSNDNTPPSNNASVVTKGDDVKKGLKSEPTPTATHDLSERVVEITVTDGHADVYRGEEKLGTTPYQVHGRLGEQVDLTLRREGYKDEHIHFDIGEKKAYMFPMSK